MESPNARKESTTTRNKPCENCRARKVKCELTASGRCARCTSMRSDCVFLLSTRRQKRANNEVEEANSMKKPRVSIEPMSASDVNMWSPWSDPFNGRDETVPAESLLNQTLGLSRDSHSRLLGASSPFPISLFNHTPARSSYLNSSLRRVASDLYFLIIPDSQTSTHSTEQATLSSIEATVFPHGLDLVNLFFRIVHPSFPILHKKVFYEKYLRTQQREFSPACLASVYLQALQWWDYGSFKKTTKPDESKLRTLAELSFRDVLTRPKLSTVQAGLLLAQKHDGIDSVLIAEVTAVAYELGLHLDCREWQIPTWEKGLRIRLAWAVFIEDKWGAFVLARPSTIHTAEDWHVQGVTNTDFPEQVEDENDEEGSAEVEKGRELFTQFIGLTQIVSAILGKFYTLATQSQRKQPGSPRDLERRAEELQKRLDAWLQALPESMDIQNVQPRKLNSVGYLHLGYWAAQAIVCRMLLRLSMEGISDNTNNMQTSSNHRAAAFSTFEQATRLVNQLRPEHLQSFWYFSSSHSLVYIASLGAELWSQAPLGTERQLMKTKLEEYRWTLRVSAKGAPFMFSALEVVNEILDVLEEAKQVVEESQGLVEQVEINDTLDLATFGFEEPFDVKPHGIDEHHDFDDGVMGLDFRTASLGEQNIWSMHNTTT